MLYEVYVVRLDEAEQQNEALNAELEQMQDTLMQQSDRCGHDALSLLV